jgi:hypothetical protein
MTLLFGILCGVIGAYWYITDSVRVRGLAEDYLTQLLGGPVTVREATLSIFEGLRLDDVKVYVDSENRPDSRLFTAASFIIEYNPAALLNGRIEATRIIAIEPQLYFAEDGATGGWNYERLRRNRSTTRASRLPPIRVLPEIVLRSAQVEYSRWERSRRYDRGSITIEGQFTPVGGEKYAFQFQSLGTRQGVGPLVRGDLSLLTGQVNAELRNFEFGEDIKAMLPTPVHRWCEQHGLAGSMDVEELTFAQRRSRDVGAGAAEPEFRAKIHVRGVKLTVNPEEWMGAQQIARLDGLRNALAVMRASGLNGRGFVDRLGALTEPAPLQLTEVDATFVFTDTGISIDDLTGKLEDVAFRITGRIDGYDPSAAADLRVASIEARNVEIPASPRYVTSMPGPVREVYDRFKPRGTASFWLNLRRAESSAKPQITGEIDILDGSFVFEEFPYPLRNATGKIVIAHDEQTAEESLKLVRIRGRGYAGTLNEDSWVEINGEMGPFTPEIGVDVIVNGTDVHSEPLLTGAFPEQTRKALTLFDAPGKGEYPQFGGDFVCRIKRLKQRKSVWIIETDIKLEDAAGVLVAFPYPMSGVTGDLKIRDDHLEIVNASMKRGDATLRIDGRVEWDKRRDPRDADAKAGPATTGSAPNLRPDLTITARDVPIDRNLLNALPESRRTWLERLGVRGTFDLDGTLKADPRAGAKGTDLDFDLRIGLKNGSFWPDEGTFAVSHASGAFRLSPTRLVISNLSARRGEAEIEASGSVAWPTEPPQLALKVSATNLALDGALYQMLPQVARRGWDQVHPEGTVDVQISYSGAVGEARRPQTEPIASVDAEVAPALTDNPDAPPAAGYEIAIVPRKLAATPQAVPYRLEELAGTVTVLPDKVLIKDLTGRHGEARVKLSATGSMGPDPVWDFQLSAADVPVDDDLLRAAPAALAELFTSLEMKGKIAFDFTKLRVTESKVDPATRPTRVAARDDRPGDPTDVEFVVNVQTKDATMNVGVPLMSVNGGAELSGSTKAGKLSDLVGKVDIGSLLLAGRAATDLRATLYKPAEHDAMQISRMETKVAGGTLAGQVDWAFPDDGPSRYAVALVLRNADVKQLTGQTDQDIRGQLTASLNIEGAYNDPNSRRGRGDVLVTGQQLYKIPLLLGLLQVTELALPITGPFRDASARYSIDGQRVTFEQVELRSKEMLMQGDGYLDFGKKTVRMTFTTDANGWIRLPLVGDLMQSARNELLQIHVRGTLQEPKVSASSFNTFTTTIDEVFRGDDKGARRD